MIKNNDRKSSSNRLLKGCAIGCAVVFLIVILASVGLYTYISHKITNVEELDRITTEVENLYGGKNDFTPNPNAPIPDKRLETFLLIRDSLLNNSAEFIEAINQMSQSVKSTEEKGEDSSFWDIVDIISSGVEIIPHVIDHFYERAYWLREYHMGFGEYYYLYGICYYSYLGRSPGDGPKFQFSNSEKIQIREDEPKEMQYGDKVIEQREISIRRRVNEMFRTYLYNLLQSNCSDLQYKKIIENELRVLKEKKYRIPWEDGLPEMITNSLEPYKIQLENSYNDLLNPIEFKSKNDFN